jgi:hypothetical protein
MGITAAALRLILPHLDGAEALSLSYPDLVMSQDDLHEVADIRTQAATEYGRWHGRPYPLPETGEALAKMGVRSLRCVDIVASRGVEDIVDLNQPQDLGRYDVVLDCGTTEHCANFWQATVNAAHAVKPGGVILHTPPLTMINHGFTCPQPTFYADLYGQNGWEMLALQATDRTNAVDIEPHARQKYPPELSMLVMARRVGDKPLTYPIQHKYLVNPGLK